MRQKPGVAIVVLMGSRAGSLGAFIESLLAVVYLNYRIWLIRDSASSHVSDRELTAVFPGARIVRHESSLGLAAAINRTLGLCLRDKDLEYVLFLSPETTHEPDFLDWLVRSANARTLVAPKVLSAFTGRLAGQAGAYDWNRGLLTDTHEGESSAQALRRDVEWASFSCLLVPVNAFRAVGPLDLNLTRYYDVDFCARARKAGFRVLLQPGAVVHFHEMEPESPIDTAVRGAPRAGGDTADAESLFHSQRDRAYLVRRHGGPIRSSVFSLYLLAARLPHLARALR